MLWLIVILLIGALSFVIFHKPKVNAMGSGWTPPEKRPHAHPSATWDAGGAMAPDGSSEEAVTAPVPKQAPEMPDTFDFNDLFGGQKNQGPTDRPQA